MVHIEICVDVPDISSGVRFYADAFGFSLTSEPYPGVAVLAVGAPKSRCSRSARGPNRRRRHRTRDVTIGTGRPCISISMSTTWTPR